MHLSINLFIEHFGQSFDFDANTQFGTIYPMMYVLPPPLCLFQEGKEAKISSLSLKITTTSLWYQPLLYLVMITKLLYNLVVMITKLLYNVVRVCPEQILSAIKVQVREEKD